MSAVTENVPQGNAPVLHKTVDIDGVRIFYREAGMPGAPAVLLPHGYPCSSYQYRNLMPRLADRWHLLAPDYPGFGYSDTPDGFDYSFSGYSEFLDNFAQKLGLSTYALYLHDYGSQIGLRLAMRTPKRISALIIQNGDIYEDALGPKYATLKAHWTSPTDHTRQQLADAVSERGFRDEFVGEIDEELIARIPPDLWTLSWSRMTPRRKEIMIGLMEGLKDNLTWFPRYQSYLREHRPPTLIVWGPQDGYMPEQSARAYLRDLPDAELHFLDGGHWLLETHLDDVVSLVRRFLSKAASTNAR